VIPGGVEVGSSLEYAAVQQFGARQGQLGRTRRGAPIPWGDIPPRPFLGLSAADRQEILGILAEHLRSGR
jgi:phage gpG-like protein